MSIELDLMEYATHQLAQAAYVSSGGYNSNFITGGTPNADSEYTEGYESTKAVDSNTATFWMSEATALPHWWKYDLGVGVSKIACKLKMWVNNDTEGSFCKDFTIQGSNNDADWDVIYTGQYTSNLLDSSNVLQEFTFSNAVAYRYYKINITTNYRAGNPLPTLAGLSEIEMMEAVLQCYSEDTIKEQGDYSLKGVALDTEALDETLIRTVDPTIDLTTEIWGQFRIRSSRTGSNIKVGIHDSGGVTTEVTPNITSANVWQIVEFRLPITANKDAIDQIIITIVNADNDNTFYLDWFITTSTVILEESIGLLESLPTTERELTLEEAIGLKDVSDVPACADVILEETLGLKDVSDIPVGPDVILQEALALKESLSLPIERQLTLEESIALLESLPTIERQLTLEESIALLESLPTIDRGLTLEETIALAESFPAEEQTIVRKTASVAFLAEQAKRSNTPAKRIWLYIQQTLLDLMEYATHQLAQAAYVTSEEYFNDDPTAAMLSSDDVYLFAGYYESFIDGNTDVGAWGTDTSTPGAYIAVDLGSGNEKAYVKARHYMASPCLANWSIQYSDNGADWYDAATNFIASDTGWNEITWSTVGSHRYWRFYLTNTPGSGPGAMEMEFYTESLQCYSESSIKQQGSYSLKEVAKITVSLNETLTRTVSPKVDLSGIDMVKFDIRASRTGSNIKIGIHDSGGVTTETTPNIIIANTFQRVEWDLSGVDDADKNGIDQIIITVTNADSANTFYIDNMITENGEVIYDITDKFMSMGPIDRKMTYKPGETKLLTISDQNLVMSNADKYFSDLDPDSLFYNRAYAGADTIKVFAGFVIPSTGYIEILQKADMRLMAVELATKEGKAYLKCQDSFREVFDIYVGMPNSDGDADPLIYPGEQSFKTIMDDLLQTHAGIAAANCDIEDVSLNFTDLTFTKKKVVDCVQKLSEVARGSTVVLGNGTVQFRRFVSEATDVDLIMRSGENYSRLSYTGQDFLLKVNKVVVIGAAGAYAEAEISGETGVTLKYENDAIESDEVAAEVAAECLGRFAVHPAKVEVTAEYLPSLDLKSIVKVYEPNSIMNPLIFQIRELALDIVGLNTRMLLSIPDSAGRAKVWTTTADFSDGTLSNTEAKSDGLSLIYPQTSGYGEYIFDMYGAQ